MVEPRIIDRLGRLAVFSLVAGFTYLVTQTAIRPMGVLNARVDALSDGIQLLSTAEAGMARLDEQIARVSRTIEESESMLPASADIERFLGRLGDIADASGVTIQSLTPGAVTARSLYNELHMRLRVTGDYAKVESFIRQLEQTERLTRVEEIQIVGTTPRQPCAGNLELALFYTGTGVG